MADASSGRETIGKRLETLMARDEEDRLNEGSRSDNEFDQFFGHSHPNPNRVGCPPAETLRALARKERAIDDSGYQHLEECSECYREFRTLQRQRRQVLMRLWVAAAAVVLMTAGIAAFVLNQRSDSGQLADNRQIDSQVTLDLRPFIVTRGGQQPETVQPLRLQQAHLDLEILLPIGFEAGNYDLRIVDGGLNTVASSQVEASMENQTVKAQTRLDLRDLAPGEYQLAIRVAGEEWHLYPARVK